MLSKIISSIRDKVKKLIDVKVSKTNDKHQRDNDDELDKVS